MNLMSPHLAKVLAGAMVLLSCACGSSGSSESSGSSGGQSQTSSSKGGQAGQTSAGRSSGGASSRSSSQGGQSIASSARSSASSSVAGGQGGQTTASGGAAGGTSSAKGGGNTTATTETGAGGGGKGGRSTQPASTSISTGGAGGSSSVTDTGGSESKDAGVPDAAGVGNPRKLLLVDEGNRRVLLMDMQSPSAAVWSREIKDSAKYGDGLRDIQLVGGDRVAVSVAKGYVELDLKTGEIKKEMTKFTGVESLRRLPNGNTILGGNFDGGATLQELDASDAPVTGRKVTFNLQNLRLFRRTPQGTFLLGVGAKLVEVNWDKQIVWEANIDGGNYVYMGLRLDKNIAVTSGYGSAIQIIEPTGKNLVSTIGGKSQADAASIAPNFYAGFQILSNGHYVVTNWQGHNGGNGDKGIQLLEYDAAGTVVWKWKQDAKLVSSLHHVLVLDGLDTTKLHDDVNGVLAPVTE